MSKDASKNTEPMDEELKDKVPETPETETVPETEAAAPAPEPTAEEKLQAQLSELNDRYLRTLAEYDNYRKRTAKEKRQFTPKPRPVRWQACCRCWITLSGQWQLPVPMPTSRRAWS